MDKLAKQSKLLRACELFIDSHQIRCAEDCYQTDRVILEAPELVEEICQIVGYYEDDDA